MELQKYEQEHLDILRPLLPECTVLLKKNGDFPLGKPGMRDIFFRLQKVERLHCMVTVCVRQ